MQTVTGDPMQIACKWQLTVFVSIGGRVRADGLAFTSDFSLCKYLMYPSGTKGGKYALESGGEVHDRSGGCHPSSWTALHPHCVAQCKREEKYRPQTDEHREADITFQPLRIHWSQQPAACEPAKSCIIWSDASDFHFWDPSKAPDINMTICSIVRGGIESQSCPERSELCTDEPLNSATEENRFLHCVPCPPSCIIDSSR